MKIHVRDLPVLGLPCNFRHMPYAKSAAEDIPYGRKAVLHTSISPLSRPRVQLQPNHHIIRLVAFSGEPNPSPGWVPTLLDPSANHPSPSPTRPIRAPPSCCHLLEQSPSPPPFQTSRFVCFLQLSPNHNLTAPSLSNRPSLRLSRSLLNQLLRPLILSTVPTPSATLQNQLDAFGI